jgi:hypothetical protein
MYSRSLHATEAECNASESCRNAVDRVVIVSGVVILVLDRAEIEVVSFLFVLRMTGLYPKYVTTGMVASALSLSASRFDVDYSKMLKTV